MNRAVYIQLTNVQRILTLSFRGRLTDPYTSDLMDLFQDGSEHQAASTHLAYGLTPK